MRTSYRWGDLRCSLEGVCKSKTDIPPQSSKTKVNFAILQSVRADDAIGMK